MDWKQTLKDIAIAIGQGLRFLVRHLLALLALTGRFVFLRAIPATSTWLRGSLFPALRRFYLWLPHRRIVVASAAGVVAIAITVLLLRTPDNTGTGAAPADSIATADDAKAPAKPVVLTLLPAKAAPGAPVVLDGLTVAASDTFEVWIEGRQAAAQRLPDGRMLALVPVQLGPDGWPAAPAEAQTVEVRRNGRPIAKIDGGLRIVELPRAPGTTAQIQRSLETIADGYERIFEALPVHNESEMGHRRAVVAMLRALVSEGDHSLAAVLAGTSPLLEGNTPDLALTDALLASSGAADYLQAYAAAFEARPAAGAAFPMLMSLPGGITLPGGAPKCRKSGKDYEIACLMQVQGLLTDFSQVFVKPTADSYANIVGLSMGALNFDAEFADIAGKAVPIHKVISALLSVANLVMEKIAPSLLPASLSRFELEVAEPLIRLHETTRTRLVVEARNHPQTITVNDLVDLVKSIIGLPKIDKYFENVVVQVFDYAIDIYFAMLRKFDATRAGSSDAVNPGVFTMPAMSWGPVDVTSDDLLSLFSYDEQVLSTQEPELEWRGERPGQATVRVMPRTPGDRSKVLVDHTLCWGCVWSGGAFGTDMPESSKKIAVEFDFDASPRHGPAPLDVELEWRIPRREDGEPIACTLDFGDGSDVERIADCTDTTSFQHTYPHTSRLEEATGGAYVAKLRLDDSKAEGEVEVFPDWEFDASPGSGKAPLDARFTWNIPWPEDRKAPACEFDPGDGSERQKFDDCLATREVEHRFERRGSFVPTLTIIDGSAKDTKTAPVSVADEFACDAEELLKHKAWTGGMSYTKNNEVWDDKRSRKVKFNLRVNLKAEMAEHTRRQWRGADSLVRYYSPLPQGSADVSFSVHQYDSQGLESYMTFVGNGRMQPQEPDMNEDGSTLNLVLDADKCTFSLFLQGQVYGTSESWSRTEGKKSAQTHYWIESAHVEQVLTSSTSISGSAPVKVIPKFDDHPTEESNWITAHPYIADALGKDNLGKVTVDWHVEPVD